MADEIRIVVAAQTAIANLDRLAAQFSKVSGAMNKIGPVSPSATKSLDTMADRVNDLDKAISEFAAKTEGGLVDSIMDQEDVGLLTKNLRVVSDRLKDLKDDYKDIAREKDKVAKEFEPGGRGIDGTSGQREHWQKELERVAGEEADIKKNMKKDNNTLRRGNTVLQERLSLIERLRKDQEKLGQSMVDDMKLSARQMALGEEMNKQKNNEIEINRRRRAAQEQLGEVQKKEALWNLKTFKKFEADKTAGLSKEAQARHKLRVEEQNRTTAGLLAEARYNERFAKDRERQWLAGMIKEARARDQGRKKEAAAAEAHRKREQARTIAGLKAEAQYYAAADKKWQENQLAGLIAEAKHRETARNNAAAARKKEQNENMAALSWKLRNQIPLTKDETRLRDDLTKKIDEERRGKARLTAEERKLATAMAKTKKIIPETSKAIIKQTALLEKIRITIARLRNITLLWHFAIRPVMDVMQKAITGFTEYEKAITGVTRIGRRFGESQIDMRMALDEFTSTGLLDITEVSQGLKNLLSTGIGLPKAVELFRKMADVAAFNRQGTMSLGEALVGATQGYKNLQSRMLDNAGLTKRISNIIKEQLIAEGRLGEALDQKGKYMALANGIIERESIPFQGDLAKSADSTSGAFAQLDLQVEKVYRQLGKLMERESIFQSMTDFATSIATITERFMMSPNEQMLDTLSRVGALDSETAKGLAKEIARDYAVSFNETLGENITQNFQILRTSTQQKGMSTFFDEYMKEDRVAFAEALKGMEVPIVGENDKIDALLNVLEPQRKKLIEAAKKFQEDMKKETVAIRASIKAREIAIEKGASPDNQALLNQMAAIHKRAMDESYALAATMERGDKRTAQLDLADKIQVGWQKAVVRAESGNISSDNVDQALESLENLQRQMISVDAATGTAAANLGKFIGFLKLMRGEIEKPVDGKKDGPVPATEKQLKSIQNWMLKLLKMQDEFRETMFTAPTKMVRKLEASLNDTTRRLKILKDALQDPALKKEIEDISGGFNAIYEQQQRSEVDKFSASVHKLVAEINNVDTKHLHPWAELDQGITKSVRPLEDQMETLDQLFGLEELRDKPAVQSILKELEETILDGWNQARTNAENNFKRENQDKKQEFLNDLASPLDRGRARLIKNREKSLDEVDRLMNIGKEKGGMSHDESMAAIEAVWAKHNAAWKALDDKSKDEAFRDFEAQIARVSGAFMNMGRAAQMAGSLGAESLQKVMYSAEKVARSLRNATEAYGAYKNMKTAVGMLDKAVAATDVVSFALMAGMTAYQAVKGPDEDDAESKRRSRDFGATINRGPQTINYNPTLVVTADGSVYFSQDGMEVVVDEFRRITQESIEGREITVR